MIEVLYFSGEHCSVCKILKPKLLTAIKDNFPNIPMTIVDVVKEQERAAQHLIFTLPVVIIMVENKEQYRFVRSFSVGEVLEKLGRLEQLFNN